MTRWLRWTPLFAGMLALVCWAMPAGAQEMSAPRVQEAIDLTDRRIEVAETLVAGAASNQPAALELNAAHDLQIRAKSTYSANQLALAFRLTTEARGHAERAIAIVRGLPDPSRVSTQVERTRDILERARERLTDCDNERARALLRVATEMQTRAETALRESRFLAALQLTMSARERAFKALRLCNIEESLQVSANRALQKTDEVITRAQDAVSDSQSEQARQALARAESLQSDATREYRAEHYEAALRLTQSARALAHRAIRLTEGVGRRRQR